MPSTTMLLRRPLSISGYWFRGQPLGEVVRLLADEFGIHSVGLWPHLLAGLEPAQVQAELDRHHTTAYALNVPGDHRLNSPGQAEAAAGALRESIRLAGRLGVPLVQIYAGTDSGLDAEENVRAFAAALRPWLAEAAARGITLAVENNLDHRMEDRGGVNPSRRPERLRMLAELVDAPNFGLVYDPCNFYTVGVDPFPEPYVQLKPWIVSVEFKDVVPYDSAVHGSSADVKLLNDSNTGSYLPVPVGSGTVDPRPILQRLADDGYQGIVALDPYATGDKLLHDCRESVAFLRRAAEQVANTPAGYVSKGASR
jgi:sugar phosphate isomerase/epimerase